MESYNKDKVSQRLKKLRELKNWSQNYIAKQLNELIGYDGGSGVMNLEGETGKQTVSQLERGARGLTVELAFAYAHIFNVSLDYIFGRSDDWKHEYKTAKEMTGFSDEAINSLVQWVALARLYDKYKQLTDRISNLEYSLKSTRNDTPNEEYVMQIVSEQETLQQEREVLENDMLTLVDAGEGYFKPPQWIAPITCQRARQKVDALSILITNEHGEKALAEMGEYFYMGDFADCVISASNQTLPRKLSSDDIAKVKLFNVQDNLLRVREKLTERRSGNGNEK